MRKQLTCKQCNEGFYSLNGGLHQQFCGKECAYKGRKTGGKKGKHYPHLQRARIGKCFVCEKQFRATKDFKDRQQKFCSRECFEGYWKLSVRPVMKHSAGLIGETNPVWKGDAAGYAAIHKWVSRWKGKPSKCENCKTITAKKFEWCNTDHQYRRNLDDWIRMCTTCHREYDMAKLA